MPDLDLAADRWPSFVPRALDAGIASVHAFPMRLRDRVIGGLNVFQTHRQELADEEVRVLQALADMATIALIQEQAVSRAELLTEQLQVALNSRIVVEQAKGAVARTFGISVDEAFELLRAHARSYAPPADRRRPRGRDLRSRTGAAARLLSRPDSPVNEWVTSHPTFRRYGFLG